MSLTAVILSFNHPELTSRAVASAVAAGVQRIVLVHNGSLTQHVSTLRSRFPEIEHCVLEPNRGFGGGANAGLSLAFKHSPWALFLTNDSTLVNLPKLPPVPLIAAPVIFRRNTHQIDSAGALFFPERAKLRHCRTLDEFEQSNDGSGLRYIPGTAFLVHRDVFLRAGPLREELKLYWDDVEWSRRIERAGYSLVVDRSWHVRHGMSKTSRETPLYSLYYFQRNRRLISWMHTSAIKRPALALRLGASWSRLFFRLLAKRRHRDLGLFVRMMIDRAVPNEKPTSPMRTSTAGLFGMTP